LIAWIAVNASVEHSLASAARRDASNLSIEREPIMPKVATMDELFIEEIRDLYDAEKQLTKALPKMAQAASSDDLRSAFEEHLGQTQQHVRRLEQIFESLDEKGTGKKCAAMAGLIKEGEEVASETEETSVRDAGLIAAAQKVEHYEISGYGSARTHAGVLGHGDAARLLEQTLKEEKETDEKLNDLAESMINEEAESESGSGNGSKSRARQATGRRTTTARS
jgi:ferritin-like metal-binding protein YciE